MQAMPVAAVMPKTTGNTVQAGVGNEDAAAEGVDFSALFNAQIKAGKGVEVEIRSLPDMEAVKAHLAEVVVKQEVKSLPDGDATLNDGLILLAEDGQTIRAEDAREQALNDGLIPQAGVFVPIPAAVAQQFRPSALNDVPSGKLLEGAKAHHEAPFQFDKEFSTANGASLGHVRVAEFAADGKFLPQNMAEKNADNLNLPALSAEPQRTTEVPVNTVPVMMVANQSPLTESKLMPLTPAMLQTPVGTAAWGEALGQKVVWMAGQQTQVAELHLNPPNLGPMEVRLSVSNDQISALFVSHHPAVREAIEAAMPRLREMLADSGMTLGNATVSSDSLPQQQSSGHEGRSGASRQTDLSTIGNIYPAQSMRGGIILRQDGSGMVDLFA